MGTMLGDIYRFKKKKKTTDILPVYVSLFDRSQLYGQFLLDVDQQPTDSRSAPPAAIPLSEHNS